MEPISIPVAVVSQRTDDNETINQALRNTGYPARCTAFDSTGELASFLREQRPVLMFVCEQDVASERFAHCVNTRNSVLPDLPILLVVPRIDEKTMVAAMEAGASDVISLASETRVQAVAKREILHCQMARQLKDVEDSARQLNTQLESLVKESADALLYVQEGIVIAANPAWLKMFSYDEEDKIVGLPALDCFTENCQTAVKGALAACAQGKWNDDSLDLKVNNPQNEPIPVKIHIERTVYDDEPCIRLHAMPDHSRNLEAPKKIVNSAAHHHPLTGFYRRQKFLSEIEDRLHAPSKGGIHALAYLKVDKVHKLREQLGPISSDDLLLDFARVLQEKVRDDDLYGQFGGDLFMILLPRGTQRDVQAWCDNLRHDIDEQLFEIGEKTISISCTIGIAIYQRDKEDIADLVLRAQKAYQQGVQSGGNATSFASLPTTPEQDSGDTQQVQLVKTALMKNNFRLVYQPVASLEQQDKTIFDALIRMIDEDGREIMPGEFLPAAERNGLMKNIDRWVIATAIRFCKQHTTNFLFVRLSKDSILDDTLCQWIERQVTAVGIEPSHMIFEVTERVAENHLKQVKTLCEQLNAMGCSFAIEHFGIGSQPLKLLKHISADFVKIDGSLMEGIISNHKLQEKVRQFVRGATSKNIATVAERVEDANTMAVLWQIGFQFVQGFYVQGPEEIVLETENPDDLYYDESSTEQPASDSSASSESPSETSSDNNSVEHSSDELTTT